MKNFFYFVLSLFLLLSLSSPSVADIRKNTVRIGFILPLSGDWAFLGNGIKDSALLAKEDLANRKYNYELIFEDNRGQLKESATLAKDLIHSKDVDALISIISGVGLVLNPLVEKAQILHIGICSNTDVAKGNYNFVNYLTAEQGVDKFVKELDRRFPKGANLGVFSLNEAGFDFIVKELRQNLKYSKSTLSIIETFEPKSTDFRSQILRAFRKRLDGLLILGLSPEIEVFAQQLKELGKKVPLMSIEGFGLAENKEAFEGQWFVDAAVPNEFFRKRFLKHFGREVTAGSGHAYDTVMMIANAFENARNDTLKPSPLQILETFKDTNDFEGVLGPTQISKSGIVGTEPSIKIIKNGKPQLAS